MSAGEQTVELLETKEIQEFIPVMKEIDFGDRFLLSMLHWCGIGRRSTPLDYWKVLLVRARGDVVGVSGLYRQPGVPHNVCWIGWFGIRPRFRREGFGTNASQDPTDVVFSALGHKQISRCEQLLLLQQQGAGRVPVDAFKAKLVARAKLSQAV